MTLTEKLDSAVARAVAITLGADATTDADALLTELNPLWSEVAEHATEMLPVLDRLIATLETELARAPASARTALSKFREAEAEAKFDRVEPPREVVAFLVKDALERLRGRI